MGMGCPTCHALLTDTSEREEQGGRLSLPALETDHEAMVRAVWYWHRQVDHWQRTESPDTLDA